MCLRMRVGLHASQGTVWRIIESDRPLLSLCHIGWRSTKICIHRALRIEQKCGENRKFLKRNCNFFSVIWVKWKESVCSITFPRSSAFYSLSVSFFVLEIFKLKYHKFFVRHSARDFQIRMIWTAVITMNRGLFIIARSITESS